MFPILCADIGCDVPTKTSLQSLFKIINTNNVNAHLEGKCFGPILAPSAHELYNFFSSCESVGYFTYLRKVGQSHACGMLV